MMLEKSNLIKHNLYFWQKNLNGCMWMMPVSEYLDYRGDLFVNLLCGVSMNDLVSLPKHDDIKEYLVEKKQSIGRRVESYWDLPKDKYGLPPSYKKYSMRKDCIFDSILIPFSEIERDYPELIINIGTDKYAKGIHPDDIRYKREFLLKNILENA